MNVVGSVNATIMKINSVDINDKFSDKASTYTKTEANARYEPAFTAAAPLQKGFNLSN